MRKIQTILVKHRVLFNNDFVVIKYVSTILNIKKDSILKTVLDGMQMFNYFEPKSYKKYFINNWLKSLYTLYNTLTYLNRNLVNNFPT